MHQYAKDRHEIPDLFLTGALNASPERAERADGPFDYFNEISSRAWSLGDNSKIHSFVGAASLVDRQLGSLVDGAPSIDAHNNDFLRSVVNAAVLPVFPTDVKHLNKTFAFCKTTGLTKDKVLGSVADGCFRTFRTFTDAATSGSDVVKRSIARLKEVGRMPLLKKMPKQTLDDTNTLKSPCPFFLKDEVVFECPFGKAEQGDVYDLCVGDPAHLKWYERKG
jgi:hypothetical protein